MHVETKQLRNIKVLRLRLEVIAGLTILAGLISVVAALHGAATSASALDLSPVTNTVNEAVAKPVSSLPVVGKPLADTTDKLLTDTVPSTVDNLTRSLPDSVNNTLDRTINTVNAPVEGVTNTVQPLTDGVGDTVGNVTESLPQPVNSLLNTLETPVRGVTDLTQGFTNTLPQTTDAASDAVNNLTDPVTNAADNALNNPGQTANDTAQNLMNNTQNGLRNLMPNNTNTDPQPNPTPNQPSPDTLGAATQESVSAAAPEVETESTRRSTPTGDPFLAQVGNFFSNLLPDEAQIFFNRLAQNGMDIKPYLISMAIFVIMIITIIGTTYAQERGKFKFLTDGDSQLAELAKVYDIPQLSLLALTVIGSSAIVFYILAV